MRIRDGLHGLATLGFLVIVLAVSGLAAPIFVSPSGQAFDAIQQAIDAAEAGSTVLIAEGEYSENLVIVKPITIIGYGPITFRPKDPEEPAVRIVDTEGVALIRFHIDGASVGVQATGSSFRMEDCQLRNVETAMEISSFGDDTVLLAECLFASASGGVRLQILGGGKLEMISCDVRGFGTGAMFAGAATATAYACTFSECYDGIVVSDTANAALISNAIEDCSTGVRIAETPFSSISPGSILLVDNTITDLSGSAISMCGINHGNAFAYQGVFQGFGNRIDDDPNLLCTDNYTWPEGLFVTSGE
jgi:hypothetical protein